jgi:ABC-type branched-subunit amino acid transport system ATPase component
MTGRLSALEKRLKVPARVLSGGEQHVHMALQVADRAMVLAHGDVVLETLAAELRRDPLLLKESYLGRTA